MLEKINTNLITKAVTSAEKLTEAEIKVIIEKRVGNILTRFNLFMSRNASIKKRARILFSRYRLSKTKNRNAVLLYFALYEKRFEILADTAAYLVLGQDFLDSIANEVSSSFSEKGINDEIIVKSVEKIAEQLATVYPSSGSSENSITDDPIVID